MGINLVGDGWMDGMSGDGDQPCRGWMGDGDQPCRGWMGLSRMDGLEGWAPGSLLGERPPAAGAGALAGGDVVAGGVVETGGAGAVLLLARRVAGQIRGAQSAPLEPVARILAVVIAAAGAEENAEECRQQEGADGHGRHCKGSATAALVAARTARRT